MELVNSIAEIGKSIWQAILANAFVAGLFFSLLVLTIDILRRRGFGWPEEAIRACTTNLTLMLSNNYFFGQLAILLMIWTQASYDHFGFPHLDSSIWSGVPAWLLVLIVIFATDFADYWTHRILHTKWFWPIHGIHHSDTHVTVLTTARVHFLEPVGMKLAYITLLGWLGFPPAALGVGAVLQMIHNMYIHINVDWGHGPFRYIIASPRFHRWHHANNPEVYNKNLANVFPIFDVLFGTYYVPGTCHDKMGADGVPVHNFVQIITFPITEWMRLVGNLVTGKRSAAGSPPTTSATESAGS